MELVWTDMEAISLPSWVTRVPRRVGATPSSSSIGLSADEWRTFCTVHLSTTLCYAWGQKDPVSREYALLSNFMDLIKAVKLALMRFTTTGRQEKCRESLFSYLSGILKLFPGTTIQSNQHLAAHVPDILARAGPSPGWSAWGLERCLGQLQKFNTNNQIGIVGPQLYVYPIY